MTAPADLYIHVVNWDKFQHGSRSNPWIKDYIGQLHKDEYLALSFHLRGVLQAIRLSYAASHRQLRHNTATLKRQLGHRVTTRDIESLVQAGFITLSASSVLTQSREEEKREEKKPPPPPLPPDKPAVTIAVRERNVVWDFVVEHKGEPLPRQRAGYGRIVADLAALLKADLNGAGDDQRLTELQRRHQALARAWGDDKATMRSLVENWKTAGVLASGAARGPSRPMGVADRLMLTAQQNRREENP